MKPFNVKYFGNLKKEKTDILILLPHSGTGEDWTDKVYHSWVGPRNISHDILLQYLSHEADRGSREIIYKSIELLIESDISRDYKVGVFDIDMPRGICDLNRSWDKACPGSINNLVWKTLYDDTLSALFQEIQYSEYCLQFHTMNGKNPLYQFEFSGGSTDKDISRFLETCYSGEKRECNILTEMISGEYLTSIEHDTILKGLFYSANIRLSENTAYRFLDGFPATEIARRVSSSLIEITKDSLGTDATSDNINSSKIVFDPGKISRFAHIFSEFFIGLLGKSS